MKLVARRIQRGYRKQSSGCAASSRDATRPPSRSRPFGCEPEELTCSTLSLLTDVLATITNHSALTSGGKKPVGKIKSAIADLYWLSVVDAPVRFLVLTNRDVLSMLEAELKGALVEHFSPVHIALPDERAKSVAGVSRAASEEMR